MRKVTATLLLIASLGLPVLLFWQLGSRSSLSALVAGAIAVAAGWALNVLWAFATREAVADGAPQDNPGNLRIAAAFGWVCAVVLVASTWVVVRFLA
jgi:hypothetical protein